MTLGPATPATERFGCLLQEAFAKVDMHDAALIGQQVALAQDDSERVATLESQGWKPCDIPYDARYVQAWFSGHCLPSRSTYAAIRSLFDHSEALDEAYATARVNAPPMNEFGLHLDERMERSGCQPAELAEKINIAMGNASNRAHPDFIASTTIDQWRYGHTIPASKYVQFLDSLLPTAPGEFPLETMRSMDSSFLHNDLDFGTSIPQVFAQIRAVLGFSSHRMTAELGKQAGRPAHVTSVMSHEQPLGSPHHYLPTRAIYGGQNPVTVYCGLLRRFGHEELADANEAHWRELLEAAIRAKQEADAAQPGKYKSPNRYRYEEEGNKSRHER